MVKVLNRYTLYFLIVTAVLLITPRAFALDMSSKRDCVVCHIMWLDDFRTDRETLVDFQPGNVLMKDTQGVVSSEEICYSCHDGYVMDSRNITWNLNRHPTFVKPSEKITIPMTMPLSSKGEIYCGTCHSAHGKGSAPHDNLAGRTSLFREINIASGLCESCHRDKASFKLSKSHPVHTAELDLPDELLESGGKQGLNKNEVVCESCHKVHGAKGEKLLIVDNSDSSLCIMCHKDQGLLVETKHDLRLTLPDEKNIKDQLAKDSGPCSACHTPHGSAGNKLWARPLKDGNPATQLCLTCHGDDTQYEIKRTGKYSHPINVDPLSKEEMHGDLPLFAEDGTKDPKGKVQCFTCHDIHRWDPDSSDDRGGKEVEGDASNSFLRISNNFSSGLCLQCHTDKKQIVTSDHNLEVTAPKEKNFLGMTPSVTGPCGVCHIPHNALSTHLWAKQPYGDKDFVTQLCTACHNENGAAKAKLLGDNFHAVDVKLDKFNISTTLPLYDSEGNVIPDGKVVCITCHDPHTWDPNNPIKDYPDKNIEGDARNSFLRRTNSPTSDLCMACHEDKAYVDGTDHDLNITNQTAKNMLGQTAEESGQCGVCHLVHNSPNKIKLWAREYGTVSRDEDIVDALCNSCHSKGNPAEKKIPLIATHPEKRLVNNIMRNNRNKLDYAPIYDKKTGKEVSVGNISCPSCHNAHQWSPLVKAKGSYQNLEGNATNSFLRNVSYNNICIDCHGLDALFRYKYYHDPLERVEPAPSRIKFTY
jgi:predicted CXXCH cytochrome family protein